MKFKRILLAAAFLALLLLSGCVLKSADELYSVPKRSDDYNSLQSALEQAMGESGTYCAPLTGTNQQAVQQADLDGDGKDEAIAYVKINGDKPLKAFVFKRVDGEYTLSSTIEGDGTSFDSVQYVQIDGAPGMELLIGRQVSETVLQSLSVYTFKNNKATEVALTNYSAYTTTDLDGDGLTDVFVLRADSEQRNAVAELYRWNEGELARDTQTDLSASADSVKRIVTGSMSAGVQGVFVASTYDESSIVTDVFAFVDGSFRNISISDESGVSTQNVRNYYVYSTDVDSDGLIELPNTILLDTIQGDSSSENRYKVIWYNLNPDGTRTEKLTTYHNYSEGWYVLLDDTWLDGLCVTRKMTEQTQGTCFCQVINGELRELLTIYTFSGENAQQTAIEDGRIMLQQKGGVYYSASSPVLQDEQALRAMFRFISTDAANNDG